MLASASNVAIAMVRDDVIDGETTRVVLERPGDEGATLGGGDSAGTPSLRVSFPRSPG